MKLIVTIPAYNEEQTISEVIKEIPRSIAGIERVEVLVLDDGSKDKTVEVAKAAGADYVISHKKNKGLAITFKDALEEAVWRGADIIVNTDADNHYDQSKIPLLIEPILKGEADIVVGSRKNLTKHRFWNKFGSLIMTRWAGLPKYDVSTGFRAYSRETAMKLGIYSLHTYVHTTLMSADDLKLVTKEMTIPDRRVERPSRLIKSVPGHIWEAGWNIVRNIVIFRPLRFFGIFGALILLFGAFFILRFLYFYFFTPEAGRGHIQSLILAAVLVLIGFQTIIFGLIGSALGWTRKVSEDILFRVKCLELEFFKKKQ